MYPVSQQFKDAIYAPIRRTTGRVTFDISDLTATGDVSSITTTSESPLSVKAQLIDKSRNATYKTGTCETDRFKLDGSFSFPDDPTPMVNATWTNLVSVSVDSGGGLIRTAPYTGSWDAGATSVHGISGDGEYIQFTATSTTTDKICGLSNVSSNGFYGSIDYSFYLSAAGNCFILEDGSFMTGGVVPYAIGDVFKIVVDGVSIKYYKNGILFYTSTRKIVFPLYVDTSILNMGATLSPVQIGNSLASNGELGWSSAEIGSSDGAFFQNILGSDGSCESLTPFSLSGVGTITISNMQKRSGNSSIKFTATANSCIAVKDYTTPSLDPSKYYILGCWAFVESYTSGSASMSLRDVGTNITRYSTGVSSSVGLIGQWQFIYVKIPTSNTLVGSGFRLLFGINTSGTMAVYYDEIRLYEITASDYAAIGTTVTTTTTPSLDDKFPYQETRPAFTFLFNSNHSSAGLTITFDGSTGEYATDFDMTAYDASNAVIDTVSVTGNTDIIATPLGQLYNYRKVSVTIKKWSVGNRRARVFEVDFGIVKQYGDDGLIQMNLIEEMDMLTSRVPSPEFKFTVDNVDRAFNILNPTGFYKYLQQKQQVIAEIGLEVSPNVFEYVTLGTYYLQEWKSNEGSITASFTARSNLDFMASFDYENLTASTKTLYQFAVDMFTLCGITNYSIDTALQLISTNSLVKKTNCRNILQMIAIAGCAQIYVTRGNVITLKCNPTLITSPIDTVDFDNAYDEPQIALDQAIKRVEVTHWSNLSTSAIVGVNSTTDTLGDTIKLENNTLINDSTRATAVANWIMAQVKYKATYRVSWRGNPATELNDVVDFENSYGANTSAYVTRYELDFAGYLTARTQAKGAVN